MRAILSFHGPAAMAASLLIAAAPAPDGEGALCKFVQQVMAEKPSGFAAFKGDPINPKAFDNALFKGTLLPAPKAECTLAMRSTAGSSQLPPSYSCTLAATRNFAAANRVFARAAGDLRACFPNVTFMSSQDGDGKDPSESFDVLVSGAPPGFTLQLEMSNGTALIADTIAGRFSDNPTVEVSLEITDVSAPE